MFPLKTVVLDHDAGTNPDDLLAALLLLKSKHVNVAYTVSGNNYPRERAQYMQHFMHLLGYGHIPCFAGEHTGHIDFYGQSAISNSQHHPSSDYITALQELAKRVPTITYICIQNLANLNKIQTLAPEVMPKLDIYHMGMTLTHAANTFIDGGTNMAGAPLDAKAIYEQSALRFQVIGGHTTIHDELRITPQTKLHQKFKNGTTAAENFLWAALQEFYHRRNIWPALHDPLTAACAIGHNFVKFKSVMVDFNEQGAYKLGMKTPVTISTSANYKQFMHFYTTLLN